MRTDRELLELAAKALGAELHFATGGGIPPSPWLRTPGRDFYWNPLQSRQDAEQLAVMLGLDTTMESRAIVRAAAEIGAASPPALNQEGGS